MSGQQHNIYQTIFDIDFFSKEKNHDMQDKISYLFNTQVLTEMDELLSEYSLVNETIQLKSLTLDLGKLRYSNLDNELPSKIIEALREELDKLDLKNTRETPSSQYKIIRSEKYDTESLEYYLKTGTLRWPQQGKRLEPEDLLSTLIRKDPGSLVKLLKRLGKNEQVRKRIAYQLSEPAIHEIIYTLEPANAKLMIDYVTELEKEEQKKIRSEATELKKAKYYFVLTYLLVERGSAFNTKNFVRSILKQMAAHFNISYNEFLLTFVQNIRKYVSASKRYLLPHIIHEIFLEDFTISSVSDLSEMQQDSPELVEQLDIKGDILDEHVYFFLEKGYLPASAMSLPKEILQDTLKYLIRDRFVVLQQFITVRRSKQVVKNLLRYFPEEHSDMLIRKYQSASYNWISSLQADLQEAQQQFSFIRVGEGTAGSERAIREAILEALIVAQQGIFNKERFLLSVLQILAQKQGTGVTAFISQTKDVLDKSGKKEWSALLQEHEIAESHEESVSETVMDPEQQAVIAKPVDKKKEEINAIKYFLAYGKMPWWSSGESKDYIARLWNKLVIVGKSQQLLRFIKEQIYKQGVRKHILLLADHDALLYPELPTSQKETDQLRQQDWIIIKNKLSYTAYQALREANLLYNFLKKDKRKEVLWEEMEKIVASHRIGQAAFYAEILQLKELIPGIYFDGFFSLLHTFLSEKAILEDQPKKKHTLDPGEKKTLKAQKAPQKESAASENKWHTTPGETTEPYELPEQAAADADSTLLIENDEDAGTTVSTIFDTYLEALLHYLHNGTMPLSVTWSLKELLNRMITELRLKPQGLSKNKQLFVTLKNQTARRRLFSALQAAELENFIRSLFYREFSFLENFLFDFQLLFEITQVKSQFKIDYSRLLEYTMLYFIEQQQKALKVSSYVQFMMQSLFKDQKDYYAFCSIIKISLLKKEIQPRTFLVALVVSNLPAEKAKKKPKANDPDDGATEKQDMTFVENAGLILLWPFFSFYFQTLELTKDHKFISKETASHAAYLLEYLVTGKEEGREHLMSLNKLLCNIPRRQPLAAPVALTEKEKKLSEELLTTAISRWDIIKNTSVEGFRESFLKRKGKIEWTEEKVNLTVEPRAYDMLVDKIPWSISVIKLPWIEKALYVKWR